MRSRPGRDRENRRDKPHPCGPSPTATTLVRGASAYALDGAASNDLIPHTARSTSEPPVITVSSNL